jgi:pescadillo protein
MKGPKRTEKDKKKSFKKAYLTRSQACRMLQISSRDFRRIGILKGIYPREPKHFAHSQGKDKQYFFRKDINWLQRDSTLDTLRKFKTYRRKLNHHLGRKDLARARDFQKHLKPQMEVAHIIRERYPTFGDALRDIDDALAHVCLYAMLPPQLKSNSTVEGHGYLTTGLAAKSRALVKRWLAFIAKTHSLRKCFISVKGFYFQAEILGETVTWLMPFEFPCKMPNDVDYYAMLSFLEFYVVMLDHVVFKLEKDNERKIELAEARADEAPEPEGEETATASADAQATAKVFDGCIFFLGRETPDRQLRFLIESFGGTIAAEETNSNITHQVVDRPMITDKRTDRDYVQPQWIFDCANKRELIHVEPYAPGKQLPPHMSPFEEALQHRVEWDRLQATGKAGAALRAQAHAAEDEASDASSEFEPDENLEDEGIVTSDEDESESEDEEGEKKPKVKAAKKEVAVPEASASGVLNEPKSKLQFRSAERTKSTKRAREDEETRLKLELATNKKRKLYKTIQRTKHRKDAKQDQLAKRFHELREKGDIKA